MIAILALLTPTNIIRYMSTTTFYSLLLSTTSYLLQCSRANQFLFPLLLPIATHYHLLALGCNYFCKHNLPTTAATSTNSIAEPGATIQAFTVAAASTTTRTTIAIDAKDGDYCQRHLVVKCPSLSYDLLSALIKRSCDRSTIPVATALEGPVVKY